MNNKFVTHSNGKITRIDLTDGLVFHKQNDLPTSINLPEQSGQYILNADGSGGYSFEIQEEQATIQLIPSQFMNADNTCAFTTGYPSLLIANSANDWTEMKLSTEYFQIIRCNGGVYDSVNLNSTVLASVAGMNKQNCSTNTILYVDGSTGSKTDNKVTGISLTSNGPYLLNNSLTNSKVDAMYVNAQNLFKNILGVNSNNKGFITYEGNTASKVNLPTAAGYHVLMRDTSGNFSFSTITLDRVVQSQLSDFNDKVIIPYLRNGSCRDIIAPTVTQTTNCLMTVNSDKTISMTPLSETGIGQVSFETHARYTNPKTVSGGEGGITTTDISELFPTFAAKTTGTFKIDVHVVLYIEDTSVFDNITSDTLCTVTLTSGSYSDSMYIMNPQQNIINIKLSVPLAISNTPSLEFNLGKTSGCTLLANYGQCLVTQYSNI